VGVVALLYLWRLDKRDEEFALMRWADDGGPCGDDT